MADEAYKETLSQILTLFPGKLSITVCEAAKILSCGKTTLYEMANDPKCDFPFLRIGGKITISIPSLARWMTNHSASQFKKR